MKKILLTFALLGIPLYGQQPGIPTAGPGNTAGLLYASNFGLWSVPQGNQGQYSWSVPSFCAPSAAGMPLMPVFVVGTPITIKDQVPSNSEIVTPTAVRYNGSGCSITVNPVNPHNSFILTSATAGLQEAINYASTLQYAIVLTPDWVRLGGTTNMITSAQGSANVSIVDERTAILSAYIWSNGGYVNVPSAARYYEATAPVPFQAVSAAFFGYGESSLNEADIHAGNGGGLALFTPNNPGSGWTRIVYIDSTGTILPANDVELTSGNCYYLGGIITEGICDDQNGGIAISTASNASNGISFQRGGTQQWLINAAGNFLNSMNQTILPSTVTTYQGSSVGGPFLVTGTTGTGATGVLAASPTLTGVPLAPTVANCSGPANQIATVGAFLNCLAAISPGVTSINGIGGTFTFGSGASCSGTTCTFPGTGASGVSSAAAGTGVVVGGTGTGPYTGAITISAPGVPIKCDVTIPITTVVAGDCNPLKASSPAQITSCTGFTSTAAVLLEAQSGYANTVGWSPVLTPVTPIQYADASPNTIDYRLCNNSANPITTAVFGARFVIFP